MRRFCARCGRPEEPERPLIGGLCLECYLEEKGVARLPSEVEIAVCPRCGSVRVQGAWMPPAGSLEEALRTAVEAEILSKARPSPDVAQLWVEEIELVEEARSKWKARIRLGARFRQGVEAFQDFLVDVRMHRVLCPQCIRRAGKAYEATLQLRGAGGRLEEEDARELSSFIRRLPRHLHDSIGEVEEKREGIDLKVLDQSSARSIASKLRSRFAAKILETHKVVGRRHDGKAKVRTTILVRMPGLRRGDIVVYNGKPAVVTGISGNRIYLETPDGKRITLSGDEYWKMGGLEHVDSSETRIMMVTAVTRDTLHLLDLENYRVVEVPLREVGLAEMLEPGDKVRVVVRGGRTYILGKA